ncbi:hypothetical protein OI25_7281 [Paraburkholderia fungorum]|uniref:Uncharacterized protein n=1 Tax=Paraburkholderia fungorum TaxID=134537 RepID=A0AAU8T9A4_9BURK|nr:hypothetical protein OI25_7281 [Paraburkholderia fungorum]
MKCLIAARLGLIVLGSFAPVATVVAADYEIIEKVTFNDPRDGRVITAVLVLDAKRNRVLRCDLIYDGNNHTFPITQCKATGIDIGDTSNHQIVGWIGRDLNLKDHPTTSTSVVKLNTKTGQISWCLAGWPGGPCTTAEVATVP